MNKLYTCPTRTLIPVGEPLMLAHPYIHSSTSGAGIQCPNLLINNANGNDRLMPNRREMVWKAALAVGMGAVMSPCPPSRAALLDEEVSQRVFEQASPSVVSIVNYKTVVGVRLADGIGTGVVWDNLGHVATNYHVLAKVDKSMIAQVRYGSIYFSHQKIFII